MSDGVSDAQILDLSNQFYTLIPHDFGMKKPPLLSNLDYIQVDTNKNTASSCAVTLVTNELA